jgi:hypothetical protein
LQVGQLTSCPEVSGLVPIRVWQCGQVNLK